MALIQIDRVSKRYDAAASSGTRLWRALRGRTSDSPGFLALRNVSLAIERGETVGIIGRNGAGKSTLLHIIAGTQNATEGTIVVNGRLAAILELGAGFDPQFTGRENARLNALLQGVGRAQLDATMKEVAEFAEIGEFFDMPVRTYSSGMYARLAFAVASTVAPDVLIVDEALAVGDVKFQTKCFRRIESLKESGTTILFVSHALDLVTRHCTRTILIENGEIAADGPPRDVANRYMDLMFGEPSSGARSPAVAPLPAEPLDAGADPFADRVPLHPAYNPHEYRWGAGGARIVEVSMRAKSGAGEMSTFAAHEEILISFRVACERDVDQLILGLTIRTPDGMPVAGTNSRDWVTGGSPCAAKEGETLVAAFRFQPSLSTGDYFVSLGTAESRGDQIVPLDRRYDALHLRIDGTGYSTGLVDLGMQFELVRAASQVPAANT
jgi:lipopolysaccharide transport system ATP-binding protein